MMRFQALASGSNGNCSVLNTPKGSLLIDVGISRKRIFEGISNLNISRKDIKYILITHAHTDHILGLPVLCDYINASVVATTQTIGQILKLSYLDSRYDEIAKNAIPLSYESPKELKWFNITAHPTIHDIAGSSAFTVDYKDFRICYATDTAGLTSNLIDDMQSSDIIVLESNHDLNMLKKSRRPISLKKRIRNNHLSNKKSIELLTKIISKQTKAVFLAHLSGECNTPEIVIDQIENFRNHYKNANSAKKYWEWVICTRWSMSSEYIYKNGNFELINGLSSLNCENLYPRLTNFFED